MNYDPEENFSPASWLWSMATELRHEYEVYWGLKPSTAADDVKPKTKAVLARMARIGEALRSCVHSLRLDSETAGAVREFLTELGAEHLQTEANHLMFAKGLGEHPIVRDAVRLELALEAADVRLDSAEKRFGVLLELLQAGLISPRAVSFLDRATRLFLWGFDPECTIMCRSVLEAALEARLRDEMDLDVPPPSLDVMLRLAGEHRLLDGFQKRAKRNDRDRGWNARQGSQLWTAERIKWTGNHVIHEEPALASDKNRFATADEAVRALATTLNVLFPPFGE